MLKLNQIIALAAGKKGRAQQAITQLYHKLKKEALLTGIARTYRPKDEDGEQLPAESKHVQFRVEDAIGEASAVLKDLFAVVATQDHANTLAKADVVVQGKTILEAVPVTHLLFLEKQLVDLHTFVDSLPTLDPGEQWTRSAAADGYATELRQTTRTKKIPRNHVVAKATKEHAEQVQVYNEDVLVGYWDTINYSGAIPERQKNTLRARVRLLQDAVKAARELANCMDVEHHSTGEAIMDYVFAGIE